MAGRPKKIIIDEFVKDTPVEAVEEIKINFDDFNHCFRCGWSKEHGAQLAIVKQEKLCQKCRTQ